MSKLPFQLDTAYAARQEALRRRFREAAPAPRFRHPIRLCFCIFLYSFAVAYLFDIICSGRF